MKRLVVSSSVLAAALGGLLAISYWRYPMWRDADSNSEVRLARGTVWMEAWRNNGIRLESRRAGFRWVSEANFERELMQEFTQQVLRGVSVRPRPGAVYAEELWRAKVSLWWPIAILAVPPALALWARLRRVPPGHCAKCRYDLSGIAAPVCPECGAAVRATTLAPRRKKWVLLSGFALVAIAICMAGFDWHERQAARESLESLDGGWGSHQSRDQVLLGLNLHLRQNDRSVTWAAALIGVVGLFWSVSTAVPTFLPKRPKAARVK